MRIRKRFATSTAMAASLTAFALFAGCGDGDSNSEESEHEAATPAKAIVEIGLVRQGLAAGLAASKQGNAEKADELIGSAYLEHFELVEGPLEERDEELNEELEELIREELRDEVKAGASAAEVEALIAEANQDLDKAEKTLKEKTPKE
jgi:high-affinity iron transporter